MVRHSSYIHEISRRLKLQPNVAEADFKVMSFVLDVTYFLLRPEGNNKASMRSQPNFPKYVFQQEL